ncbi:MAG: tRNA epoxyqueuosine(34) reductase QueG [Verrucomicrobia bacterium]|nr:tRNA epoxyqueuosine(34) reductase QueG [Verrucomicrobiota bacterium]
MTTTDPRREALRRRLADLGFDDVRFAAVAELRDEGLAGWLAAGHHADMAWMERSAAKRLDPRLVLPGVQSVILLGVNYWTAAAPRGAAAWARYALHDDYHDTMKPALVGAGRVLEEVCGLRGDEYRYYVDTGPVLERSWAARAGLGFIGKNAMLISRRHGNWLLLAAILVKARFEPDAPVRERGDGSAVGLLCGKCTRCLAACPTAAFPRPGVVDARRCISYQTIENKGVIPRELRRAIGNRIYGCDVCLEVCPWNRFAQEGRRMLLAARPELGRLSLPEILALTPERFAAVFRGTPIKRLKLAGLLRNACIVAGNSGDASLVPALLPLASHSLPLVRAHAVWAVRQLGGAGRLAEARAAEQDATVLAEHLAES